MKKKLLIFLFLLFILVGCSKTTNTPKGEVQKLFSNYMNLSSDVLIQLDNVIGNEDLTDDEKSLYKDILKKQYQDIKYKIKNVSFPPTRGTHKSTLAGKVITIPSSNSANYSLTD